MRETTVYFDLADTSDPKFDRPIEILLIGVLAIAPLALGAVEAWSEAIVIGIALAMAAILALKLLFRPDVHFIRSWTYWPIGLFLLLVALQLVPLPAGLVKAISPTTHFLKDKLLSELPGASERLQWMPLSFYREGTLHDLRLLIAVVCIYVVVVNCIRRVSQIRRLLGAIAIIAGVFAVVSLAQTVIGVRDIYGMIPMPTGQVARSGPFINHSHFGQFMNLSIGAAVGLGLVLINQHFRRDDYSPGEIARKLRSEGMRPAWILLLIVMLSMCAVMMSLSRGAMLGAAIGGLATGLVLITRPGVHGRIWIIVAIALCLVLALLPHLSAVVDRWLSTSEEAATTRMEIWRGVWRAWRWDFTFLGSGLGTFSVVFPLYDPSNVAMHATHAENEYAQLLMEGGAIGFIIALVFLAMVATALIRAVRGSMSPASSATLGLMFGLIAVLVHSFTDFGQHIPAVAILTAVTCALVINLGQLRLRELDRVSSSLPSRGNLVMRIGALVVIVGTGVWLAGACFTAMNADRAWQVVRRMDRNLQQRNWAADNAQFADIINAANTASQWRPGDINYHYWLNYYRWKSVARFVNADGKTAPDGIQYFPQIIEELHAGRWLAPTHGPTYLLAAQLEAELPDRAQASANHLHLAWELSKTDPIANLLRGELYAREGDMDQAMVRLRRAAELDRRLIPDVIDVCVKQIGRPELALQLAGEDIEALDVLANVLSKDPATAELAEEARERSFVALQAQAQDEHAPADVQIRFAEALVARGRREEAIPHFRRALNFDYGRTDWRMSLARALAELGRNDEAIREAKICLTRREMKEARELIDRLSHAPATQATTK